MERPACSGLTVLVLAPIGQDGPLVCQLLRRHGISAVECSSSAELAGRLDDQLGAVLLTEEAADEETLRRLAEATARQSPWLDLPILLCSLAGRRGSSPRPLEHLQHLGNVLLLERPVKTEALVSAVRAALRSRRRQLRLKLLADMTEYLVVENDPQKMLADVWSALRDHLPVSGYLYHVTDERGQLKLASSIGVKDSELGPLQLLEPHRSEQAMTEYFRGAGGNGAAPHAAAFALVAGQQQLGMLTFLFNEASQPAADERALLRTVCDHVALALRRARTLRDLQLRAEELAESDRRKDEFLAMLGHELRNPLAALTMAADVLQLCGAVQPAGLESLELVRQEARHITRLVDDLLDVSRITRGKIELQPAPMDFNQVVAEAVEKVRPQAQRRNHRLLLHLESEPLYLMADHTRLRQVVENLVTNAVKYTDPGGTISVSTQRAAQHVELRVRDTGIGLTPEMQHRVFELFVQDGRALDRAQGGLGIGLTLVQRLVELHGGQVRLYSEGPGAGSEFVVQLPLAELPHAAPSRDSDGAAHTDGRSLRVLIVEDMPNVGEVTRMLMECLGHQVKLLRRGGEALSTCEQYRPEVVFLDIGLPDMDGYEVARRLRQRLGRRCPMLVAVTGYGQSEDRARAKGAGFDHHLTKPASAEALQQVLREAARRPAAWDPVEKGEHEPA